MKTEHKQTVMVSLMWGRKQAAATESIKAKAGKRQINYSAGMLLHGVYTNNLFFIETTSTFAPEKPFKTRYIVIKA